MNEGEKDVEYQQAVAQLDATIAKESPKISSVGYLLWSLAVPPFTTFLSMYFAWKKNALHRLMPDMTIVYTILFALWSLLMFSAPGAFASYFHQQVVGIGLFDKIFALILVVGGLISGFYLRAKANKEGALSLTWIGLMIVLLVLQVYSGWHQLSFISGVVTKAQDTAIGL